MDAVTVQPDFDERIDRLVAAALRGEGTEWPAVWNDPRSQAAVIERVVYHGVAGLLVEADPALLPWPEPVLQSFKQEAIHRAVWEMRHRLVLCDLLTAFSDRGVRVIVLKGTAIAYDLYERPACRARGDTDLLVETGDLADAREILTGLGYVRSAASASDNDEFQLQEVWRFETLEGVAHHIDLHWQAMNSPALAGVLDTAECMASSMPLPRLCEAARAMDRVTMLVHALLHRAGHITAPFFSGGCVYYGGDRLIWIQDIDKLARAMNDTEWSALCEMARSRGVARVCLGGLDLAHRRLTTRIPDWVIAALDTAPGRQPASAYLLDSGQLARNWRDLRAKRGFAVALSYLTQRILPSRAFMRAKYPAMTRRPIAWLYLRRLADLMRRRPGPC